MFNNYLSGVIALACMSVYGRVFFINILKFINQDLRALDTVYIKFHSSKNKQPLICGCGIYSVLAPPE